MEKIALDSSLLFCCHSTLSALHQQICKSGGRVSLGLPGVTAKVMIVHKECLGDTMHCNCVHKAFSVAQAFLDRYFPRRELFRPLASFLLRPAPQYHHKITAFKRKHFTHFIIGLQVCARALPVSLYMKSLHGDEGCTCLFLARFQANNTLCLPPSYLIKKWKASLHQCLSKTATQHFHTHGE